MAEVAFAARLRGAMDDAGIPTAAELERRWVAAFGGKPANVHRQVMRLLNHTESPRPETAERLAELTGKPADYFTAGQPERRQSRLADLERRLAELAARLAETEESALEIQHVAVDLGRLARAQQRALEELRGALEARVEQLERLELRVDELTR